MKDAKKTWRAALRLRAEGGDFNRNILYFEAIYRLLRFYKTLPKNDVWRWLVATPGGVTPADFMALTGKSAPAISQALSEIRDHGFLISEPFGRTKRHFPYLAGVQQIEGFLEVFRGSDDEKPEHLLAKALALFAPLTDPFCYLLWRHLCKEGAQVRDLQTLFGAAQPETSAALARLREAGLVECEASGNARNYFGHAHYPIVASANRCLMNEKMLDFFFKDF